MYTISLDGYETISTFCFREGMIGFFIAFFFLISLKYIPCIHLFIYVIKN